MRQLARARHELFADRNEAVPEVEGGRLTATVAPDQLATPADDLVDSRLEQAAADAGIAVPLQRRHPTESPCRLPIEVVGEERDAGDDRAVAVPFAEVEHVNRVILRVHGRGYR